MKTILISGAGIAGPSLAYWLTLYGFRVTVVEQAHTVRNGGYAVDFRGNSIKVLEKMGILDEVKRVQTHAGAVSFVNKHDARLATMSSVFISGELEILRSDLGKILYNLTKETTEYMFGDSIVSIRETGGRVAVAFEKSPRRTFDIVVGADGTHSTVRSLVFGQEDQFIRHLGYGIAVFSTKNYLKLDHTGHYFATPGRMTGLYSARNNTQAKAHFYFTLPKTFNIPHESTDQKKVIEDIFSGQCWQVPKLLSDMRVAQDFYFDTVDQIHMPKWSEGHIVLLGDAAYCASPLSGAGTGLAIVGAYILAGELKRASNDVSAAFKEYECRMRPYAMKAQRIPQLLGVLMIPKSRILLGLRIVLLKSIAYIRLEKFIIKLARLPGESTDIEEY